MNFFLQLPLPAQQAILFLTGCLVGGQLNRGIYRLAFFPRPIGPWSAPADSAPVRAWYDRIPVVGWLGLARESAVHGRGYWLRPLLVELATGGLFVWWYQVTLAAGAAAAVPVEVSLSQYLGQIILLSLMIVATMIDFDEQTIPDSITLPGTLAGLMLAAALPTSLPRDGTSVLPLLTTTPLPSPAWVDEWPGLLLGLALFNGWVLAILPKTWYPLRGLRKALGYMVESIRRSPYSRFYLWLSLAGSAAICLVFCCGHSWWQGLFVSLVGMAGGGAIVWGIRISASSALGQEAMGFGDVTLMAMIGSFIGWQMSLLVFFLAPLAGLVIAILQWLFTRRHDIAYGPYLCLAAAMLLRWWDGVWETQMRDIFRLGWWIPVLFTVCVLLIWLLLWLWRRFLALLGVHR